MFVFDKETFIQTIKVLQQQYDYDCSYSILLEKVFNVESVPSYDNTVLTNHLFVLLQKQFPVNYGVCEIQRFCYDLKFGYCNGKQVLTPADLWESLHTKVPLALLNNG